MIIGIDFDNTIVTYDGLFEQAARDFGLALDLEGKGKREVRDLIRMLPEGEVIWQRIQAWVYGPGMEGAVMTAGVDTFIRMCREEGFDVFVVSHKTRFAAQDPMVSLRDAATRWLTRNGFFDRLGFAPRDVYFEATRLNKLNRVAALGCTHFIDDLPEVLEDEAFPAATLPILYAPDSDAEPSAMTICRSWDAVAEAVFRFEAAT